MTEKPVSVVVTTILKSITDHGNLESKSAFSVVQGEMFKKWLTDGIAFMFFFKRYYSIGLKTLVKYPIASEKHYKTLTLFDSDIAKIKHFLSGTV